jgi:hypothetical protein
MKQNSTIKNRTRKCKGVNTAKSFPGCGEQKIHHRFGLCSSCFAKWLYNTPEGHKYLERMKIKAKKEVERKQKADWRAKKKKLKEQTKNWKHELQTEINKIVRLIDKGQPCLARGTHAKQIHAGHVFSVGSNQTIRFNLHNIHRQSAQSNHFQNDDGLLREGLRKEYGQDYFEFVSGLRKTPDLNLKNGEYKELTTKARQIRKQMEKDDYRFNSPIGRIDMRNWINAKLGIYEYEFCEYKQPQAQ